MAYWVSGALLPWDDNKKSYRSNLLITSFSSLGINTLAINPYRQGVEIKTFGHLFSSTQPKIWTGETTVSGTVSHNLNDRTLGQIQSFVDFYDNKVARDVGKFNPVEYIANVPDDYPFPSIFNDGPQQQQEAAMEIFTIPMRKDSNEGPYYARAVRGNLDEGNNLDGIVAPTNGLGTGNSQFANFYEFTAPVSPKYYLDSACELLGQTYTGSIRLPGYTTINQRTITPFSTVLTDVINQINHGGNGDLINVLLSCSYENGDWFRPRGCKSSTSGGDTYGRNSARFGTDSIAFAGTTRGS